MRWCGRQTVAGVRALGSLWVTWERGYLCMYVLLPKCCFIYTPRGRSRPWIQNNTQIQLQNTSTVNRVRRKNEIRRFVYIITYILEKFLHYLLETSL